MANFDQFDFNQTDHINWMSRLSYLTSSTRFPADEWFSLVSSILLIKDNDEKVVTGY